MFLKRKLNYINKQIFYFWFGKPKKKKKFRLPEKKKEHEKRAKNKMFKVFLE